MLRLRILEEAADELEAAVAWSERSRTGRGVRLLGAYAAKLEQIVRAPESAPRVLRAPGPHAVRAFTLRRFRYSIIVVQRDSELVVVAVAHHRRAPGYWHARLR